MSAYRAPYDRLVRSLTIGLCALFGAGAVALLVTVFAVQGPGARVGGLVGLAAVLTIPAVSYLLSPVGYRITPGALVVERPAGPLALPLHGPVEAWRTDRLGPALRVWGDGGLFGGYGRFWSHDLGLFRAYVRRNRDFVVVRTPSVVVVVAPDDPERFLHDLSTGPGRDEPQV